MRGHCRLAALEGAPGVAGDALAALEDRDRTALQAHVQLAPCVLTRHRIVVAVDLDVVVDAETLMMRAISRLERPCSKCHCRTSWISRMDNILVAKQPSG